MIFISHNHNDKIIIEPIAIQLAEIFGKDNVFYDSCSMQPGDGIIDKMNEGLEKCTHFFFFVSSNSINSNMVKMEWQNAIYKTSKGKCKVVPVRLDETSMPAILAQSLYIDLYSNGLNIAIGQIVNVIQGNSTFNSNSNTFSNISYKIEEQTDSEIIIKIYASHFLEPIAKFIVLFMNKQNEINISLPYDGMFVSATKDNVPLKNGKIVNAKMVHVQRALTPSMPITISIKKKTDVEIKFIDLLHQTGERSHSVIPRRVCKEEL